MKKKGIIYLICILVAALLLYNSVYIKKLDNNQNTASKTNLMPEDFAKTFYTETLVPYLDSSVAVGDLLALLKSDPEQAFQKYSKKQGIGSTAYFLVSGEGTIQETGPNFVTVNTKHGDVKLQTGLYFGNAIRDLSGKINMGDFTNTMDYNQVSAALNKIVKTNITDPFKAKAAKGQVVQFVGCAELNKDNKNIQNFELLPLRITTK